MQLTDWERQAIAGARELAGVGITSVREHTGESDLAAAYAVAFTRAQASLRDLLRLVDAEAAPEMTAPRRPDQRAAALAQRMSRKQSVLHNP